MNIPVKPFSGLILGIRISSSGLPGTCIRMTGPGLLNQSKTVRNGLCPGIAKGRFVKPSGGVIWFHGEATPVSHGNELVYSGVFLDITERKIAEKILRDSEGKFPVNCRKFT